MVERLVYIVEDFPSLTETFIQNEIIELINCGYEVKIFALKKPGNIIHSIHADLIKYTTYSPPLFSFNTLKNNFLALINDPKQYVVTFKQMIINNANSIHNFSRGIYGFVLTFNFIRTYEGLNYYLHCHFAGRRLDIAFYSKIYFKNNFKIGCTIHAVDIYANENEKFMKKKLNNCDLVVCTSFYLKNYITEELKLNLIKNLVVVHYGININFYDYKKYEKKSVEKIKIISVGRLIPKKGFDILIKACDFLNKDGLKIEVNIIGDGPEKLELVKLTNSLNLMGKVNFLGAKSQIEVKELLYNASVFVLACRRAKNGDMDGIPNVLIEAMAIGLPVISTIISGIPELIDNNINGFIVNPEEPEELAQAIMRLHYKGEYLSSFNVAGREKVVNEFEISTNTKKLISYINDI